ncbi:MAG: MFS transporter, partial [Candidatus Helarchaeota archaeon]|nr:MFS transporter [Candidatus Helarchaeota archaeon]
MESTSFWEKFFGAKYFSYFIIFFANIIGWQGSLHVLSTESTLNLFAFILASIPLSLLIGKLDTNPASHRKFILIGFGFYIGGFSLKELSTYGFTLINSAADSIFITVLLGIAFGITTVAIGVYFAEISFPRERGKLQGLSYCIVFAFMFILPLEYFIILGIILICLIIFLILYKPLSPSDKTSKSIESPSYRAVFKHKSFIYFVCSFLLLLIALPFIQIFFYYGSLPTEFGLIELYSYFPLMSISALIGGFLMDRGRKSMTLSLFLILGLGFAIWGIIPESIALFLPVLVTIWILFGVGNAFANVFDYIIPSDYASPTNRGKYIAL